MLNWILYLALAAVLLGSLYLTLLNLPGLWIMVLADLLYAVFTKFAFAGFKTFMAILLLAGIAELIDFLAGAAGAKKAGASRRGLVGAVIGGIAGGIILTFFLPVILTFVGICIGTFVGAIVGELWGGTEVARSMKIGFGAAWGRLLGILTKLLFGCAIVLAVLLAGLPHNFLGRSPTANPLRIPSTAPSTFPAKA